MLLLLLLLSFSVLRVFHFFVHSPPPRCLFLLLLLLSSNSRNRSLSFSSLSASSSSSASPSTIEQLRLDVREFGKEAGRLGVDVTPFAPYKQLLEVVEAGRAGDGGAAIGGTTSR